jgi:hypothetical protein
MNSVKDLREQLQKEKLEGRERPWGYRLFQRGPSIYITRLLIYTPLTPNSITLLSILSGLSGAFLLLTPDWKLKLLALALFYLHLLFDRVDGELARYKQIFSLKGIYLDEINHYIVPPLFFTCLAWGLKDATIYDSSLVLLAGLWAGFAVIFLRLTHTIPYGIFLKKFVKHRDILSLPQSSPTTQELRNQHALMYPLVKLLHQFQDFFIIVLLFTFTFSIERFFAPNAFLFPYTSLLLFGYALYLPLIVLENIVKGILTIEARMRELDHL